MKVLPVLRDVVSADYVGPGLSFSELHVARALESLGYKAGLGRMALSREIGLGGGAVRTLIKRLKERSLIVIDRYGCKLTRKGQKVHNELVGRFSRRSPIAAGKLATDRQSVAMIVRDAGSVVGSGLEARDAVIRAGATGATTVTFKKKKFIIEGGSSDCASDFLDPVWGLILRKLRPQDNDVVIISSASQKSLAEYGALAAALEIIK